MNATKQEIAAVFTEWERRFRETPDQFMTEFERVAVGVEDYGAQCAAYFVQLLEELKALPRVKE